jgi:hypothetical protein
MGFTTVTGAIEGSIALILVNGYLFSAMNPELSPDRQPLGPFRDKSQVVTGFGPTSKLEIKNASIAGSAGCIWEGEQQNAFHSSETWEYRLD